MVFISHNRLYLVAKAHGKYRYNNIYAMYRCMYIYTLQAFHIQLAESEDEDEQQNETEGDSSGDGVNYAHRPPTIDEIDSVLGQFRRDAEVRLLSHLLENTNI